MGRLLGGRVCACAPPSAQPAAAAAECARSAARRPPSTPQKRRASRKLAPSLRCGLDLAQMALSFVEVRGPLALSTSPVVQTMAWKPACNVFCFCFWGGLGGVFKGFGILFRFFWSGFGSPERKSG